MSMTPADEPVLTLGHAGGAKKAGVGAVFVLPVLFFVVLIGGWKLTLVLLVLVAGLALLFGRKWIDAMVNWHPASLDLYAPYPFVLGSRPEVRYRRSPRKVRDINDCQISFVVSCQEVVTYRRGTSTHTDRNDVVKIARTESGYGTANGLEAMLSLEIPAHGGAPTCDLGNNEIKWFIEIQTKGPGMPADTSTFDIGVAPTLDRALRAGVQDS